jgi:hypothetical protein
LKHTKEYSTLKKIKNKFLRQKIKIKKLIKRLILVRKKRKIIAKTNLGVFEGEEQNSFVLHRKPSIQG